MPKHNTQFSIAVHLLARLGFVEGGTHELEPKDAVRTSRGLAKSINADPSFIRRILSKLSKAGLIKTSKGHGGACALARPPQQISLFQVYAAIEGPAVFTIHDYPAQKNCPISSQIKETLGTVLGKAQSSMEKSLKTIKISTIIADITL